MRVTKGFGSAALVILTGALLTSSLGFAQNSGWRRFGDSDSAAPADSSMPVAPPDQAGLPPVRGGYPDRLMIPAGKFITVRANQPLSSDHNQVGDFFTVTLADPVVIDGVVVAQRGQTLSGRVTEVAKGGHFGSTSRLAIQLTELTLVDGQQVPIQTQLVGRKGPSTTGRDAAIIAGTAGMGAAIGAASTWDWDKGAGIGAGIGAAVGLVGALVSPGAPAVVYPETLLSFRIEQAVGVDTSRSPQSFQQVNPAEYSYSQGPAPPQQPGIQTGPPPGPPAAAPYPYPYPYPYPAPYPYPYTAYAYPYPAWGFGVVVAPGYYYHGGHYYYHGGYYGHHH